MKTRVQVELPIESMQRLRNLKERLETTSYSEVIRRALKLYELALDKKILKDVEILM